MNSRFGIKIDYARNSENPSHVFRAMADLIDALNNFDAHIAHTVNAEITSVYVLDNIETGSITSWLRNVLKGIPDDALKNAEWKRIIGQFLFETRNSLIEWMETRETISTRQDIKELQDTINFQAEKTQLLEHHIYSPPPPNIILADVASMKRALDNLENQDTAQYLTGKTFHPINHSFQISEAAIRELLTLQTVTSEVEGILQIKKPDYLGHSKWIFRFQGHLIEASVTDQVWLTQFQSQVEQVLPGDSIQASLKSEISYGYDGEVVHAAYEVTTVSRAIPASNTYQSKLFKP